jgi:hypothetical protein
VLTAGPDAETAIDGIHRLMFEIRDRAENLKKQWEASAQIVERLANPRPYDDEPTGHARRVFQREMKQAAN